MRIKHEYEKRGDDLSCPIGGRSEECRERIAVELKKVSLCFNG
jgi:hypothetical protein